MANRPARFTAADLRRAAKIAMEIGYDIKIASDGTIRIVQRPESDQPKERRPEPLREIVF